MASLETIFFLVSFDAVQLNFREKNTSAVYLSESRQFISCVWRTLDMKIALLFAKKRKLDQKECRKRQNVVNYGGKNGYDPGE